MSDGQAEIRIRYRRPAHGTQEFVQRLVVRAGECVVTLAEAAPIAEPLRVGAALLLEPGAPVVWFSFRDAWHDIGRFHDATGSFTGVYANILAPVHGLDGARWAATDLCLDLWLPADGGEPLLLDADELHAAVGAGHISGVLAARAQLEAETLLRAAAAGAWPPAIVQEWPLERARDAAGRHFPTRPG